MSEATGGDGYAKVSLRVVALASCLVALTCLAVLVVVVSVKDVDVLSTVALALAIVAFIVQLIVFVVQAAASSQQVARANEVYASTMAILSQLQERALGTQKSLEMINLRLLDAALGKASSEGLSPGTAEYASRVAEIAHSGAQSEPRDPASRPARQEFPEPLPHDKAVAINDQLSSWPGANEIDQAFQALSQLSGRDQVDLYRLARDALTSTEPDAALGPGLSQRADNQLGDLVQPVAGWNLFTLSDKGRNVGRVLTAPLEDSPAVVSADYRRLRKDIRERHARRLERARSRLREQTTDQPD